jgi:excisionase family DNA binding protein
MQTIDAHETPKRALSITRFAAEHDIGRDTVYALIKQGKLIARKIGRRTVITEEDAKRFREGLPPLELPPAR